MYKIINNSCFAFKAGYYINKQNMESFTEDLLLPLNALSGVLY